MATRVHSLFLTTKGHESFCFGNRSPIDSGLSDSMLLSANFLLFGKDFLQNGVYVSPAYSRVRVRDKIWEGGPPLGGWGLISKPAGKIGRCMPFFKRLFAES